MLSTVGKSSPTSTITAVTTATLPPLHPPGTQTQYSYIQSTLTPPKSPTPPIFAKQQRTLSSSCLINTLPLRTLHSILGPLSSTTTYKLHRSCNMPSRHCPPLHRTLPRILENSPHLFWGCTHHNFRGWTPTHFWGFPPQLHIGTQLYILATINHAPSLPHLLR